jgi:hypothetical protein
VCSAWCSASARGLASNIEVGRRGWPWPRREKSGVLCNEKRTVARRACSAQKRRKTKSNSNSFQFQCH